MNRQRCRKLNEWDDLAILLSYRDGETLEQIAKRHQVTSGAILKVLDRWREPRRPCWHLSGDGHPRRKVSLYQEREIADEYRRGMIQRALANRYGITIASVSRIIRKHGIVTRRTKETGKRGHFAARWRGGISYDEKGYRRLYLPDYAKTKGGLVKEHRYVMEQHLGNRLGQHEVVHHLNGIKDDNRIENLRVMTPEEHRAVHQVHA